MVTALLWSLGGVFIKNISLNGLAIAGWRSLLALPVLLIVLRRRHLTLSAPQIAGALCYAACLICFVCATKLTTAANAILLQYTAPIFVAILGLFYLKEKVTGFDWLTIAFALTGIALFFLDDLTLQNKKGNLIAIASGLAFAGMFVFLRKQKDAHPLGSVFIGNILVGLTCLPFMFHSMPDTHSSCFLLLLGFIQVGLAYILYAKAITRVGALESIMITTIEPILNPVWVLIFIGEQPGRWALIGGFVVIATILARAFHTLKSERDRLR
jgi:drug/metabolite transporter (DMT)-like permease